MLTIRLQRVGRKHDPSYRIVATDSRNGPKTNKHVAILGSYDTIRKTTIINDAEKIKQFIAQGAQLTDTVHNIFVKEGVIEGSKVNPLPRKQPIIDEEALAREAEEKQAAEEAAQKAEEEAKTEEEEVSEAPEEEEQKEESESPEEETQEKETQEEEKN